ncbi:trypsin-like serine protease [Kutzneria chonburiensis]|uniref:Trypsin-like serine protease n=1 Tax=Kutzneria chonburiensis TaxID=1483604 RepID=A0ABV6MJX2_9PSEU|nr:trypsin-like serine protease [Kutzneria chonburiensis]
MAAGTTVTADAVSGGTTPAAGTYGYVARLTNGTAGCSGALIDPQWVITASACFPSAAPGKPSAPITVTFAGGAQVQHVTWLVQHADRDVVLAKLDNPVAITPVPLAATGPVTGETLQVAGFGRTTTDWVPDQPRVAPFTAGAATGALLPLSSSTGVDACKGDAGGPAIRDTSGQLVAITHLSFQHGCLGSTETRQGISDTRVDDLAPWIAQTRDTYRDRDLHLFPLAAGVVWHNVLPAHGTVWQHLDAIATNVSYVASGTMANGDIALATISNQALSLRFGHRDGTWTAPTVIDNGIAAVTLGADTDGDLHVFPLAMNGVVWHNILKTDGTWQRLDAVASNVQALTSTSWSDGSGTLVTVSDGTLSKNTENSNHCGECTGPGTWIGAHALDTGVTSAAYVWLPTGDDHVFPLATGVVWHNVYKPDGTVQRLPEVARNASSVAAIALGNGDVYVTTISGGNVSQTVEHADGTATGPTVIDSGGSVTQEALTLA